jgi:AbrB family looped-hinge helix DNA binding protein
MRTTIDKAGRVVIPASIRDRTGLSPGTTLEITAPGSSRWDGGSWRGRRAM